MSYFETRLTQIMLEAEIFCSQIRETLGKARTIKHEELRLRLDQCRGALEYLQSLYEDGTLNVEHRPVLEAFRHLVKSLMWVSYHRGEKIHFELFLDLVQIQESFASLLIEQIQIEARRR